MKQKNNDDRLDQILIKLVQEKKPATVKQLVNLAKLENPSVSEQKILQRILFLEGKGELQIKQSEIEQSHKFGSYLKTKEAAWYWVTTILAIATALAVSTIQEDSFPLILVRNILGVLFVMFLPGYSLVKTLFPKKELGPIEYAGLSVGLSLALAPIIGLILHYTPLGLELAPLTISLLILTIIFATIAIVRDYQTTKK